MQYYSKYLYYLRGFIAHDTASVHLPILFSLFDLFYGCYETPISRDQMRQDRVQENLIWAHQGAYRQCQARILQDKTFR